MRIRRVLLTLCAMLSCAGLSMAEPIDGIGLFGGPSSSQYSEPGLSLTASGMAYGVDYQAVVGPQISINPHLLFSHEKGQDVTVTVFDPFLSTFVVETEFDYTVLGVHVLVWPTENFYLGGGISNHTVKLTVTEKTTRESASDTESDIGLGLALGYADSGGLTLAARYDTVEIQGSTISSLRFLIGYRFGGLAEGKRKAITRPPGPQPANTSIPEFEKAKPARVRAIDGKTRIGAMPPKLGSLFRYDPTPDVLKALQRLEAKFPRMQLALLPEQERRDAAGNAINLDNLWIKPGFFSNPELDRAAVAEAAKALELDFAFTYFFVGQPNRHRMSVYIFDIQREQVFEEAFNIEIDSGAGLARSVEQIEKNVEEIFRRHRLFDEP